MNRRTFLKWMGLSGFGGIVFAGGALPVARNRNSYYSGPVSDHFDGTHFFNPQGQAPKGFVDLVKWQLGGGRKKWPEAFPSPHSDTPPERIEGDEIRVSYVGHATALFQINGFNILTDPVWSERASPVQFAGPKRVNNPGIAFDDLPPIDVVLLSHNHYDHLDLLTLRKLHEAHEPVIYTPLGNDTILLGHDRRFNVVTGDWGDRIEHQADIAIHFEPAHHWSARGVADRRHALWAAFVIESGARKLYFVGDTGFHDGINYRAAREKHGEFDLAMLPFGAYEPRDFMSAQHQNPDEAVQGHILCNAKQTLGHHWGTFQLTNESIEDQLAHLDDARKKHNVAESEFRALYPGETWTLPEAG